MPNNINEIARQRIKTVLDLIEQVQANPNDPENPLNNLCVDDDDLRSRLMVVALLRPLTIADVLKAELEITAALGAFMTSIIERESKCLAKSEALILYRVTNTAKHSIDILAGSVDCARLFARQCEHVQDEKNAKVSRYKDEYVHQLRISGSATGRAMREGIPGVLEKIGSGVVIKRAGKVYIPMTVVPSG